MRLPFDGRALLVSQIEDAGKIPESDSWDGPRSVSNRSKARDSSMTQLFLIGIGAGAATALLFASVASGSLISVLLFYLAPLPILIAALGWSHWAALIAAVFASAGLAAVFGSFMFVAFLFGIGLPAWWLGYLALLARPTGQPAPNDMEWYPAGNLVVWAAILGALIVIAALINFGAGEGGFRTALRNGLERMLRMQMRAPKGPPLDLNRTVEILMAFCRRPRPCSRPSPTCSISGSRGGSCRCPGA